MFSLNFFLDTFGAIQIPPSFPQTKFGGEPPSAFVHFKPTLLNPALAAGSFIASDISDTDSAPRISEIVHRVTVTN